MRLTIYFLIVLLLNAPVKGISQNVNFSGRDVSLEKIFHEIEKQTGTVFMYRDSALFAARPVTIQAVNTPLPKFLEAVLKDQPLNYTMKGKNIFISVKPVTSAHADREPGTSIQHVTISGQILDQNKMPLAGATVTDINTPHVTITDLKGQFSIATIPEISRLVISSVGFVPFSITVRELLAAPLNYIKEVGKTTIQKKEVTYFVITLAVEVKLMEETVVNLGMFNRRKEGITGAVSSFTGPELLAVGNTNVLKSLKTLDPSFNLLDNIQFGSNPNKLPDIEIRGRSSLSPKELNNTYNGNPNLPLFILDGFESDLQTISDLNINRVANITILKDAASTAIYGSRAANGVVVVETRAPRPGKVEVNYSSDLIVNAPFLNDYNLMNGAEKLEFERLSGMFTPYPPYPISVLPAEADYHERLSQVKAGVNTYWLNEPLRTGFSNGHNINISGGSNELRFNAGLSYKNDQGVMKVSGRDTWRGSLSVTYRNGKLNINDQLLVNGYTAIESPYGDFANFSRAVPYYKKRDSANNVPEYLNIFHDPSFAAGFGNDSIANPLYVATLGNRNTTKSYGFGNNLQATYDFTPSLRLSGALSLSANNNTNIIFRPAEDPEYRLLPPQQKGLYSNAHAERFSYQGNIMLTYAKLISKLHSLSINVRSELQENRENFVTFGATGFATGSTGSPNLASQYTPYGRPDGGLSVTRRNNILGSVNYVYDSRFLLDFSYRYDGSTAFGSAKRYSPFWAVGLGWNLHRESIFKKWKEINLLKIRANIGYTGNQQFAQTLSVNVYQQLAGQSIFGEMTDLSGLGNPNLKWQRTQNLSSGIDFGFFNNRLNGYVNYYKNTSSPLIIPVIQAASSGVAMYSENTGTLAYKGIEIKAVYALVSRPQELFAWNISLTMAHNEGKYNGFNNRLNMLNKEQQKANSYIRYRDGNSPEDIWAVRSAGIDRLTGQELFVKKDGSLSFNYDSQDEVVIGCSRPKAEGIIGSHLNYKGLTVGMYLRYSFGADQLNNDLYNKVENLSATYIRSNNLDKRALYDRWQKPGDIAAFKSITDFSYTPISSRFVQRENYINGESLTVGYNFINKKWLKRAGLQNLAISAYTSNLFRWSTIRMERGIDYPFASSVSANISATF